jgi:putative toxin-antitoxin system antitoxin component (TIGR02293 family)
MTAPSLPRAGEPVNVVEFRAGMPNVMGSMAQEWLMVTAAAVAGVLGGIGRRRTAVTDLALANAVRDGLPVAALARLIADGVIAEQEVEARFIPRRTLYARRQKGTLSREQSDLVVRLARTQAMADEVFGSREKAHAWLREANGALANQKPLFLLDTEEGGRLVEAVLGRIAHGIVE